MYTGRFDEIRDKIGHTYLIVIEDEATNIVVATASIIVRSNLFHLNRKYGLANDLVVRESYQGRSLSRQ